VLVFEAQNTPEATTKDFSSGQEGRKVELGREGGREGGRDGDWFE